MKNILIVDDDKLIIRLLSTELRKAGYATFVSFDVVQAVTAIRRHPIDAVLLDMRMPGGSGEDVIRRLKLSKRTGQIPIFVVTGSVPDANRVDLIAMGAEEVFFKPPDMKLLLAKLAEVPSRSDMQDEATEPAEYQDRLAVIGQSTEYFGA